MCSRLRKFIEMAAKCRRNLKFLPRNGREIGNFRREMAAKFGVLAFRGAAKFALFYRDKQMPLVLIRELVCYGHCMRRSLWSPICSSSLRIMEKILPMVGKVLGSWALSLNVGIWIGKVCLIHLQPWVCNKFLKISLLWVTIEYFILECCVITTFAGQWIKLDN